MRLKSVANLVNWSLTPISLNTVHPTTFVVFKHWLAQQVDRDPLKRRRDVLQAGAVQVLLEQYLPQV